MKYIKGVFELFFQALDDKHPVALISCILLLYLLFRAVRLIRMRFVKGPRTSFLLQKTMPIVEMLSWVSFSIWAIFNFVIEGDSKKETGNWVFLSLLVVLVLIFAWFMLRDFVAGLILRLEGVFELNDRIKTRGIEGMVKRMGYRAMQLETDKGEWITVPYSKVIGNINAKLKKQGSGVSSKIRIEIDNEGDWNHMHTMIKRILLNAPWVIVNKKPLVTLVEERENVFIVDCIVYVLDHEYLPKLKGYLKQQQLGNVLQVVD